MDLTLNSVQFVYYLLSLIINKKILFSDNYTNNNTTEFNLLYSTCYMNSSLLLYLKT